MNEINWPAPLRQCFADVYEPAEDSFFLLDVLEKELFNTPENDENQHLNIAVELCCGSGIITANLARRLSDVCFFCTDVNPSACRLTEDVARLSNCYHNVHVLQTDMCSGLDNRLAGCVDLLYCNPPYVPTDGETAEEKKMDYSLIGHAWAGGKDGIEAVVDRFLPVAGNILSPNGVAYLLMLDQNKPEEVVEHARINFALYGKVISTRRFFNEQLSIAKFWR